jgi:hypothetical protein
MGLVLGLMTMGAMAQQAATDVNDNTQRVLEAQTAAVQAASNPVAPDAATTAAAAEEDRLANLPAKPASAGGAAAAQLPMGVTTEQNPLKVAFMAKATYKPALFRPNQNMPEIVNEDLLRGYAENGKAAGRNVSNLIGYMPKLKVIPCQVECSGADYERAVAEFIKGYEGDGANFQYRGEMPVQVRWFKSRGFLQTLVPYGSDEFGISFMLEGKVISLGKAGSAGGNMKAHSLAYDIGAKLGFELAYTLGMGVKPSYLSDTNNITNGVAGAIMTTGTAVDGILGVDDVRPRVEPATEANSRNLLPAIDGIQPNEVLPIAETRYINTLLF